MGCEAGTLNASRIKGSHAAIKSGMLAAEAAIDALAANRSGDELTAYPESFRSSWLHEELHRARNFKPWMSKGLYTGTATVGDSAHCVILEYDADGGSIRKAAYGQQAQATGSGIFITKDADIFITGRLFNKKTGAPGEAEQIIAFQYKPNATSVWERQYSPGHNAGGVDLVVNGDVYVAANVKAKTNDVLVCRLSRPLVPTLPAAK